MPESGPTGDDPFGPFLGDLARMMQSSGPVNWETAQRMAAFGATGGKPEDNPDPVERIRLEELARVADLRIADLTGLSTSPTGRPVSVVAVTRSEFARRSLEAFRPLFEAQATSMTAAGTADPTGAGDPAAATDPLGGMFAGIFTMIGPMVFAASSGSLVGHLARHSLGQYDVPIPRPSAAELVVVPANLTAFAEEWSLDLDDLRLWLCLSSVATHAVLGVPHVRARLDALLLDHASSFGIDHESLERHVEGIDPTDPAGLERLLGDPRALLGMVQSPRQKELRPRIEAILAVLIGYVDWAVEAAGSGLLGSYSMVTEALHRRRIEADEADQLVEQLLGLSLGEAQYERGQAFVSGVVERAGPESLARLWTSERELPTPAEVDAPGLWLARIDLPG